MIGFSSEASSLGRVSGASFANQMRMCWWLLVLGVCHGDPAQQSHKSVHDELTLLQKVTAAQTYSGNWYETKDYMR
jgi:hypothetical protein